MNRLQEARENSINPNTGKSYTQDEVAEKLHIEKRTFQNLEYSAYPKLKHLISLSELYGVSIDYLVGRQDEPAIGGKEIEKLTGLSQSAILQLEKWNHHDDTSAPKIENLIATNMILSSDHAKSLTSAILQYILSDFMFVGITETDIENGNKVSERGMNEGEYLHFRYTVSNGEYEISDTTPLIDITDRSFVRTNAIDKIRKCLDELQKDMISNTDAMTEEDIDSMIELESSDHYHKYVRDIDGNLIEIPTEMQLARQQKKE